MLCQKHKRLIMCTQRVKSNVQNRTLCSVLIFYDISSLFLKLFIYKLCFYIRVRHYNAKPNKP
ncbi:hypothetical protein M2459_002369 [Parabacteroides sp. PF5-5]|nr:hypothetical protein [Parabacteroides sp. PH5-39]MDH6316622.1 hypothetical protein [Parabacteroides sp. PF5-13]MDH6320198.1 hypothetical protein [Parabacteroides sp. PH5-13]MDH6323859.1 hypothetical protein [Parabacteroides sp. PH5-8]MDH6327875.1 hypothetical protein [Parabacteroides sp. PH5-41]MDH6335609.1 hypothetical protein [Parabacteroides sp. PF5-5]MDH6346739.1 hypothetical protein [Parabacteroides sp. PH5-46]MDH6361635.1 hypothetical protein [Parabacteroides sp. PH5-16]MDH6377302.